MGYKRKQAEYAEALGEKYAYFAHNLDSSKYKICVYNSKRECDLPYMEAYDRVLAQLSTVEKDFVLFSTNLPDERKGKRRVKGGLDCIAQVDLLSCLFAEEARQSASALQDTSREVLNSNNIGDMLEHLEKLKFVVERNIVQKTQHLAITHRVLSVAKKTPLCTNFLPNAFLAIEIPTIDDYKVYILEPSLQQFLVYEALVSGLATKIRRYGSDQPGRQSEGQSGDELTGDLTCEVAGEPVSDADEPPVCPPGTLYQLAGDPFCELAGAGEPLGERSGEASSELAGEPVDTLHQFEGDPVGVGQLAVGEAVGADSQPPKSKRPKKNDREWNQILSMNNYCCRGLPDGLKPCTHCGDIDELQEDHIKPWSRFHDHALTNRQPLCLSCHNFKTKYIDTTLTEKKYIKDLEMWHELIHDNVLRPCLVEIINARWRIRQDKLGGLTPL